jgi:hypothetical protein
MTESETLNAVNQLLKSGQTQAASDLLTSSAADAKAAEDLAAGIPPPPVAPRDPVAIVREFFVATANFLGNPDWLTALIAEFDATLAASATPAPATPLTAAKLAAFNASKTA